MDKKNLNKKLDEWIKELPQESRESLLAHLSGLKSTYPFNEYEYRLMYLLDKKIITFQEYEKLRNDYVGSNIYLEFYGLATRAFGVRAEDCLIDIDGRFKKASKKNIELKKLDPDFKGEYDLYLSDNKKFIKVEVKSSRATNSKERKPFESKASYDKSLGKEPLWMNFQQIKLDIADVFVFVGMWVDKILYWVLTNEEIKKHPLRSHQHRGGIEYQIGITDKNFNDFKKFLVEPSQLINAIKRKSK